MWTVVAVFLFIISLSVGTKKKKLLHDCVIAHGILFLIHSLQFVGITKAFFPLQNKNGIQWQAKNYLKMHKHYLE